MSAMDDNLGLEQSSDTAGSGVAVLDRTFSLLAAFRADDEQLTLSDLAQRAGLYKSTALRLLAALEHGGFVRRLSDGHYAVGPEPLRLAAIYRRSFRLEAAVEPELRRLSQQLGETASLYVRTGQRRLVIGRVEPLRAVRVSIRVGEEFEIEQGASGKVLLAFSDDGADAKEDDTTRSRYWATSFGERDPEAASAAAPVFGPGEELIGALTVSGPLARLHDATVMHGVVAAVLDAAARLTDVLGGDSKALQWRRQALTRQEIDQSAQRRSETRVD